MNNIFKYNKVVLLTGIMIIVSFLIATVSILLSYNNAKKQLYARLTDIVNREKSEIQVLTRDYNENKKDIIAYLEDVKKVDNSIGKFGEIVIANQIEDSIKFLISNKSTNGYYEIVKNIHLAKPMHKALKGESGILKGKDYQGINVFAAYTYSAKLNLGIVAKIPAFEINKPFIVTTILVFLLSFIFISISSYIFLKITNPLINKVIENEQNLVKINETLKKTNLNLKRAKEKAEESDRLKSSFLNNMSHEVRTPLNAIVGFAKLMAEPNQKPEKLKMFSRFISTSSDKLIGIIADIIEISIIQANLVKVKITEIDVIQFINNLAATFAQMAEERKIALTLNMKIPDNEYFILSDSGKLKQIITHLVDNALKFTPQGSIEITCEIIQDKIQVSISDTGIGISLEMQKIIFQPFRQVELGITRNFGGNGLGLSIAKAYIEILKGSISLKSEIDKGTTVTFSLPANKKERQILPKPIEENVYKVKTILIVEDEYTNYQYLLAILEDMELEILYAANGKQALDLCRNNKTIDLILMDIKMPVMDGHTATKLIKEFMPEMPIIAQTGYVLESERVNFINDFDDYITKPISKDELKQKLIKYMN